MATKQGPLLTCPECGAGSYHHSLPDRAWDECENGHVLNLGTYENPDLEVWLAHPGVQMEVEEGTVIERGVFPDVPVTPPGPPWGKT